MKNDLFEDNFLFEEEKEFYDSIKIYMSDISKYPRLSQEEVDGKIKEMKSAEGKNRIKIRNEIVNANLRLVVHIAKKYSTFSIPFLDIIQDGNVGLITAVEKYNPAVKAKFSSYCVYWIVTHINRGIENRGQLIRLPNYIFEDLSKMRKTMSEFLVEMDRYPNDEELEKITGINMKYINAAMQTQDVLSLDQPASEFEDLTLSNIIADEKALAPDKELEKNIFMEEVNQIISGLSEREEFIIRNRFGCFKNEEDRPPKTLIEIAGMLNISRERVRQIEKKVLAKIRNNERIIAMR